MEPMNATALFKEGRLEIWTGNQAPTLIRDQAAKIAGLAPDAVTVYTPLMGGGFGRRAEFDVSNQAVRLAMVMPGTPIKLTWSREEDMRHDFYRPAAIARMKGVASSAGPSVLTADIAAPSVLRMQSQRALGFSPPGPDKILVEGAYDQPYAIANYRVRGFISNVAVPVGAWRSVGNSHNAFFHECFLDELAVAAKIDPVAMRLSMMKGVHEPSRKVVEAVAEMASWGKTLPAGKGRGMAFTMSFGTPTAEIVEISSTPQGLRIDKVWCAIDVGTALDPRNIEAQVMSGIVFGLSAAVTEGISFKDGAVVEGNFNAYDPLRLYQCPFVETRILENNRHISGVGEPGTPPAAPALANAVFNLTGKRIRELPLSKHVAFA
jgi:isoquinoline 1-oxidoreductase beta subunit